jgi:hypothetical protein
MQDRLFHCCILLTKGAPRPGQGSVPVVGSLAEGAWGLSSSWAFLVRLIRRDLEVDALARPRRAGIWLVPKMGTQCENEEHLRGAELNMTFPPGDLPARRWSRAASALSDLGMILPMHAAPLAAPARVD